MGASQVSLARELAERICALRYQDLPPAAVYASRVAVLDTVGVMLAGSREDAPRIVAEVLALDHAAGPCLVFGTARRAGCLDAALVNGSAAHVLDFDNTASNLGGHVSAVVVPALLAAAEAFGASGRDLLLGHTAGFETGRIGRALNPLHSDKGWHPTSTIGVFAVAAACARMLGLSVAQTEMALALSASLAAGVKANFGTMAKSLHAGQCARSGLLAALLARKGFTANPDVFEHRQGFFELFGGSGNYDAGRALAGWLAPYDSVDPGASYKLYPCCYSTHAAVQGALELARAHGPFEPDAIARVDVRAHESRLLHTDRPDPESPLEAKFSIQYCVARALLDGKVTLEHFEADAHREPRIRRVLPRVHAAPYTGVLAWPDDPFDAEVAVELADGRTLAVKVDRPLGRTAAEPIPYPLLQAKFEDCAAQVVGRAAAAAAARRIETLEELASLRELTTLLEPAAAPAEARSLERIA
jgi:2-methylcitrate dehydratase PrpD